MGFASRATTVTGSTDIVIIFSRPPSAEGWLLKKRKTMSFEENAAEKSSVSSELLDDVQEDLDAMLENLGKVSCCLSRLRNSQLFYFVDYYY